MRCRHQQSVRRQQPRAAGYRIEKTRAGCFALGLPAGQRLRPPVFVTTPVAVAAAVVTALGMVVVAATATIVVDNNHMAAAVAVKTCTICSQLLSCQQSNASKFKCHRKVGLINSTYSCCALSHPVTARAPKPSWRPSNTLPRQKRVWCSFRVVVAAAKSLESRGCCSTSYHRP